MAVSACSCRTLRNCCIQGTQPRSRLFKWTSFRSLGPWL